MSGRNSALRISDYSAHTHHGCRASGRFCRDREMYACAVCSAVCATFTTLSCKPQIRFCTWAWGQRARTTDQFTVRLVRFPLYGELLGTDNSARTSNRAAVYVSTSNRAAVCVRCSVMGQHCTVRGCRDREMYTRAVCSAVCATFTNSVLKNKSSVHPPKSRNQK